VNHASQTTSTDFRNKIDPRRKSQLIAARHRDRVASRPGRPATAGNDREPQEDQAPDVREHDL
jgi:hypothetical protein